MKKFLPQKKLFPLVLNLLARDFNKMIKYIFNDMFMIFSVSSFTQQTIFIDNRSGGFNINESLKAGSTVGNWVK